MLKSLDALLRLIIGVGVAGYVGAWIAEDYRNKADQYEAASGIFRQHTELVNKRLFLMSQVLYGMKNSADPEDVEARWDEYRRYLGVYNTERGANRIFIELYFGAKLFQAERDLHYAIREIGQRLECRHRGDQSLDLSDIERDLDGMWRVAHDFTRGLGVALRDKQIGDNRFAEDAVRREDQPNYECRIDD